MVCAPYYHFDGKVQLFNWIFRSEFIEPNIEALSQGGLQAQMLALSYVYDNRDFYKKTPVILMQKGYENYILNVLEAMANVTTEPIFERAGLRNDYTDTTNRRMYVEVFRSALSQIFKRDDSNLEAILESFISFYRAQALSLALFVNRKEHPMLEIEMRGLATGADTFRELLSDVERGDLRIDTEQARQRILGIPY